MLLKKVVDFLISKTRLVGIFVVFAICTGMYAYFNISVQMFPKIDTPFLTVNIKYENSNKDIVADTVVSPLERLLVKAENIKNLTSYTTEQEIVFVVELTNPSKKQTVREQILKIIDNNPDVTDKKTVISPYTPEQNTIEFIINNKNPDSKLSELFLVTQDVTNQLYNIPEISKIDSVGNPKNYEVEISVDKNTLKNYGISVATLHDIVKLHTANFTIGTTLSKNTTNVLKYKSSLLSKKKLEEMSIPIHGGFRTVPLKEISTLSLKQNPTTIREVHINGLQGIWVKVQLKETVDNVQATEKIVKALEEYPWPPETQWSIVVNHTDYVLSQFSDVATTIVNAFILVTITTILFFGLPLGITIGATIPISLLISLSILYFVFGIWLNSVVLFGIWISLGILIDAPILTSHQAKKLMKGGEKPKESYAKASRIMFAPILGSTVTTIAALTPIFFWPGTTGQLIKDLPLTVITILIVSIFVTVFFLPTFAQMLNWGFIERFFKRESRIDKYTNKIVCYYEIFIEWLVTHPARTIGTVVFMLFFALGVTIAVLKSDITVSLIKNIELDHFSLHVGSTTNLSLKEKSTLLEKINGDIKNSIGKYVNNIITDTSLQNNYQNNNNVGTILLILKDWKDRIPAENIMETTHNVLKKRHPDLRFVPQVNSPNVFSSKSNIIPIQVTNLDENDTKKFAKSLEKHIGKSGQVKLSQQTIGFIDIAPQKGKELLLGDMEKITKELRGASDQGLLVGKIPLHFHNKNTMTDLVIRYIPKYKNIHKTLSNISIETPIGQKSLSTIVTTTHDEQSPFVEHLNGLPVQTINIETSYNNKELIKHKLNKWLDNNSHNFENKNIRVSLKDMQEQEAIFTLKYLKKILPLISIIIFMLLLTQFHLWHTIVILLSIVFSLLGGLIGVLVSGGHISVVMTGLGCLFVFGLAENHNITTISQLKSLGKVSNKTITQAVTTRIIPVSLTNITTILALIFPACGLMFDFSTLSFVWGAPNVMWYKDLAIFIIWSLGISSFVILFLTPALLSFPQHCLDILTKIKAYIKDIKK